MAVFYTNRAGETKVFEVGPADTSLGPIDLVKAFVQEHFFSNSNTPKWSRFCHHRAE
jgi:hypothetical protein